MDIALTGVLIACVAWDGWRGALRSVAVVLALVAGVYGGGVLARAFPLLGGRDPGALAAGLNYLLFAVGLFLAVYLVSRLAFAAARLAGLKKYDHGAGVALGLVRGVAVASLVSYLAMPVMKQPGKLAPFFSSLAGRAVQKVVAK